MFVYNLQELHIHLIAGSQTRVTLLALACVEENQLQFSSSMSKFAPGKFVAKQ